MNQQQRPRSIGWNPFLNRVLRLVVSPIPAIATMIPNFPILFNQPDMSSGNKSVEFMIAVSKKPMINHGKILAIGVSQMQHVQDGPCESMPEPGPHRF